MTVSHLAYPLVALAALAGCATGPAPMGGTGAPGSASGRWESRVATLTLAERIADVCYSEGIFLAPSPYGGAVHRATEELAAEGVDRATLEAAYANHDFDTTTAAVQSYLSARGASEAAPASLCAVGESEIAQGSELGRVLQKS